MSTTTIRAPRTWYRPTSETYAKASDIKKFEVRHSMIKGDGLFAAPQFVCFQDEVAKANFVVNNP